MALGRAGSNVDVSPILLRVVASLGVQFERMSMDEMYKHSLFVGTCEELEDAERIVQETVEVEDVFSSNDGETGTLELRFFTQSKLGKYDQRYIVSQVQPQSYALNCEEY